MALYRLQMTLAREGPELDIRDALNFDVIESQITNQMNVPCLVAKVRAAQIGGLSIQSDAKLRPTICIGELDVNISSRDALLECLNCILRPQTDFNRMLAFRQSFHKALCGRFFGA